MTEVILDRMVRQGDLRRGHLSRGLSEVNGPRGYVRGWWWEWAEETVSSKAQAQSV